MIVVAGDVTLKAETRDEAVEVIKWMVAETQKEAGCISYNFYSDLSDPTKLKIFEEWESMEHLAAHFETDHMTEFRSKIPNFVAEKNRVFKYEVTEKVSL